MDLSHFVPRGRLLWLSGFVLTDFEIFQILGGAGDKEYLPSKANYQNKIIAEHLYVCKESFQPLVRGFVLYLSRNGVYYGSLGSRTGRFLRFRAGWRYSYRRVCPNPNIEPYCRLCTYLGKDSSAWAEVWAGTWPSGEGIVAPGGRDLGNF